MELKQGYKQTEIGVIPKDWDVKSIEQLFHFYSTSNYSKAQMNLEGEVGCLHYGLIHAIKYSSFNVKSGIKYYVAKNQAKYELILDGDIVMVDASEDLSGVNKSVEIEGVGNRPYIAGLHTFLLRDRGYFTDYFRGAILNSNIVKPQMLRLAVGMKVYGVSKPQLKTVLIPIPPLPEQAAIANALSDMDALISQTEKLIEKKKAIKQGAMQELLKPKEGWVETIFKDILHEVIDNRGKTPPLSNSGFKLLEVNSLGNLFPNVNKVSKFVSEATYSSWFRNHLEEGDLLFSTVGNIGQTSIYKNTMSCIAQNIVGFRFKKANSIFLKYYFDTELLRKKFQSIQMSGVQPSIKVSQLLLLIFSVPTIEEQSQIAYRICDMDLELNILESKVIKLKQQKQGMMQALLTGKIRLVS
jgi:type I restriction enzyme S subunit